VYAIGDQVEALIRRRRTIAGCVSPAASVGGCVMSKSLEKVPSFPSPTPRWPPRGEAGVFFRKASLPGPGAPNFRRTHAKSCAYEHADEASEKNLLETRLPN